MFTKIPRDVTCHLSTPLPPSTFLNELYATLLYVCIKGVSEVFMEGQG